MKTRERDCKALQAQEKFEMQEMNTVSTIMEINSYFSVAKLVFRLRTLLKTIRAWIRRKKAILSLLRIFPGM